MGLFDLFKKQPEPESATEVLDALISAHARKKWKRISQLCERHEQIIRDNFAAWKTVPESIRSDRRRTDNYVHALIMVAKAFENAGIPELLQLIVGDGESNPLLTWDSDLQRAVALIGSEDFQTAIDLLIDRLLKHQGDVGPGMDHFLPRTHGLLGIAYFHTNDIAKAKQHTNTALTICQETGDADGVTTYSNNLQHINQ